MNTRESAQLPKDWQGRHQDSSSGGDSEEEQYERAYIIANAMKVDDLREQLDKMGFKGNLKNMTKKPLVDEYVKMVVEVRIISKFNHLIVEAENSS